MRKKSDIYLWMFFSSSNFIISKLFFSSSAVLSILYFYWVFFACCLLVTWRSSLRADSDIPQSQSFICRNRRNQIRVLRMPSQALDAATVAAQLETVDCLIRKVGREAQEKRDYMREESEKEVMKKENRITREKVIRRFHQKRKISRREGENISFFVSLLRFFVWFFFFCILYRHPKYATNHPESRLPVVCLCLKEK